MNSDWRVEVSYLRILAAKLQDRIEHLEEQNAELSKALGIMVSRDVSASLAVIRRSLGGSAPSAAPEGSPGTGDTSTTEDEGG